MSEDMNSALSEINNNFINGLIESSTDNNVLSGGFCFLSSDKNKANIAVLIAAYQKRYDIVTFLMVNDLVTDYSKKSQYSGQTLLQHIVVDYPVISRADFLINKILQTKNISSFINSQDNDGNTALHLAAMSRNDELCERLISAGANKNIKNKNNNYVATETEVEPYKVNSFNSSTIVNEAPRQTNTSVTVLNEAQNDNDDDEKVYDVPNIEVDDDQKLVDEILQSFLKNEKNNMNGGGKQTESSESFHGMTDFDENALSSVSMDGGNKNVTPDMNTEEFISQMMDQLKQNKSNSSLTGGRKAKQTSKRVIGTRRMATLSEYAMSDDNKLETSEVSTKKEPNNTSKIHEEVVEIIKKMLKDGVLKDYKKTDEDDIELDARVLKAALYKDTKEKTGKKGEDLANEMKTLALKKTTYKKLVLSDFDEIKEHIKNKPKRTQQRYGSESSESSIGSSDLSDSSESLSATSVHN